MSAPKEIPLLTVLATWDEVVEEWNLDPYERSRLLGGFGDGDVADIRTYETLAGERRMRLCVELAPVLGSVLGDRVTVRAWLRRTNRNLGDRTPLDAMSRSPEWTRWFISSLGWIHDGR